VRAQPVGETAIEGVGVDAPALVLDQVFSGGGIVAELIPYQSRRRAEEFAELLKSPQHTGGNHTAEVDQHCSARHPRGIEGVANGRASGHACSYLSFIRLTGNCV